MTTTAKRPTPGPPSPPPLTLGTVADGVRVRILADVCYTGKLATVVGRSKPASIVMVKIDGHVKLTALGAATPVEVLP